MQLGHRRFAEILAGTMAAIVCFGAVAAADTDARLAPLLERMQALFENPKPVFVRQNIDVVVDGQSQGEQIQEVWVRDMDHLRVERSDGTVVVLTPEDVKLYVGPPRVLLHVPQETLTALGDKRAEALSVLGLSPPRAMYDLMIEGRELLVVTGEDTVAGEACWLVTLDEKLLPRLREVVSGVPDEFKLRGAQMAIGKESGMARSVSFEFDGPAQLTVSVIVEEIAEDAEVTDEMLSFQPPEEALVLTWTADKTAEQMRQAFQQAIAERMKG
jgi:hypothetical protein